MENMSKKRLRAEMEQQMLDMQLLGDKTLTRMNQLLEKTMLDISEEINYTYYRYKKRFNLTDEEMVEVMNSRLSDAELLDYVNRGILAKEVILDRASFLNELTRLTVLKEYIGSSFKVVADTSIGYVEDLVKEVVDSTRARTVFAVSKEVGFELELGFQKIPKARMDKLLHHNWMDSNFYKRIQNNCGKLQSQVEEVLTSGVMRGDGINKMAMKIEETTNYGKVASRRLVRTEVSHFLNKAEAEQLEEWGEEFYEISATLDSRTCHKAHKDGTPSCGEMDGKVFKQSEKVEGKNAPVFHP